MTSLLDYLPHRSPMLLIDKIITVSDNSSEAEVEITATSSFCQSDKGVPAWIGLEYMGQTAALIAGHQKLKGEAKEYVGFLLGTRRYNSHVEFFAIGQRLRIQCQQLAVVGETLATFQCTITLIETNTELATAKLSVFRKPAE